MSDDKLFIEYDRLEQQWDKLHERDFYDILEDIRRTLNSSEIEGMNIVKKSSKLGTVCPYYLQAKSIFKKDTETKLLKLLEELKQHE